MGEGRSNKGFEKVKDGVTRVSSRAVQKESCH